MSARVNFAADLTEKILVLYAIGRWQRKWEMQRGEAALVFHRPRQVKAYYNLFRELV